MEQVPQKYPSILTPAGISLADDVADDAIGGSWGVDDTRLNRSYTVKLKLFVASKYTGPAQVIGAIPLNIGDYYQWPLFTSGTGPTENDTGSFLQRIEVARGSEHGQEGTANAAMWLATLYYEPFDVNHQLGNSDISQGLINPLDRYPEVYWSSAKYGIHKVEDEGDPPMVYLNTVGDPLLDPPEVEETRPTLKFIRNESTFNDDYAAQFKDTVNSDVFLGYPPNTVKCSDITGERRYDADWGNYFQVTYMFEFRDDDDGFGYTRRILNAGYRQLVGGSGSPVNVVDASGNTVTDAVPLQENGAYTPGADPYFLEFVQFPAIEFEGLNIPEDVLSANI